MVHRVQKIEVMNQSQMFNAHEAIVNIDRNIVHVVDRIVYRKGIVREGIDLEADENSVGIVQGIEEVENVVVVVRIQEIVIVGDHLKRNDNENLWIINEFTNIVFFQSFSWDWQRTLIFFFLQNPFNKLIFKFNQNKTFFVVVLYSSGIIVERPIFRSQLSVKKNVNSV